MKLFTAHIQLKMDIAITTVLSNGRCDAACFQNAEERNLLKFGTKMLRQSPLAQYTFVQNIKGTNIS